MLDDKSNDNLRDKKIICYLLNQMEAQESEEFEEAYFVDYSLFERTEEVEEELVADYAKYKLLGHPFKWAKEFEQHYLANPERRQRVEREKASLAVSLEFLHDQGLITKVLEQTAQPAQTKATVETPAFVSSEPKEPSEKRSWWESLFPFLQGRLIPVMAAAVAVLLLVSIGLLILNLRLRNQSEAQQVAQARRTAEMEQRVQELQQQIAAQQGNVEKLKADLEEAQKELEKAKAGTSLPGASSPVTEANQIAYLNLNPGLKGADRNVGAGQGNVIEARAQTSIAQISALIDTDEYKSFNAVVKPVSGNNVVWQATLKVRKRGRSLLVTASIPIKNFPVEFKDYLLVLNGVKADGSSEEYGKYSFKVERK